ncbi:hypothetical protein WSM22_39810 [Cytophagales bacterium WSM2-2]|nr:hypothetical protein WSM22_39810 [Cytophagales bacterium WSM2-2]
MGILLLLFPLVSKAQQTINFEKITVDQGLSQSAVSSVLQDKYGYLWIGTLDGLNRFDGSTIKIYQHTDSDPSSIISSYITGLHTDHLGNLWITHEGYLSKYINQSDSFISYSLDLPDGNTSRLKVNQLFAVNDSLFYLATNTGILAFNPGTRGLRRLEKYKEFDQQQVNSLVFSTKFGNWITTHNKIYRYDSVQAKWDLLFTDSRSLLARFDTVTRTLFVQTKEKLVKYESSAPVFRTIDTYPASEDFDYSHFSMMQTRNKELWVARRYVQIYDVNGKRKSTLIHDPEDPLSLSGTYLSCLYESNDGTVWIGTNGLGLNKYNPSIAVFNYIGSFPNLRTSLSDNFVSSIYTKDDNKLLVGTLNGLDVIDLEKGSKTNYDVKGINGKQARLNKIFTTSDGVVWLCTTRGLKKFNSSTISPCGNAQLDNDDLAIHDFCKIGADTFIFTTNRGLYSWSHATGQVSKVHNSGSMSIGVHQGNIWIESKAEIKVLDGEGKEIVKTFAKKGQGPGLFPAVEIKCFYEDKEGNFWIGTWGGGLSLYSDKTNSFTHYNENSGLRSNVVYGILEDDKNHLWLSTNKGLAVFDKLKRTVIRNFEKADGLQSNEFNTRAFHKSPAGKLYFGGINGLNFFEPDQVLSINSEVPKTVLAGFFLNNVRVTERTDGTAIDTYNLQELNLAWNERNFGFEITGLGFGSPGRYNHKYILENYDTGWNFIGKQKRISFTNIPAGKYVLRVKSSNALGDWENGELKISVSIDSPFWQKAWVDALFAASLVAGVFGIYYFRTQQLRARTKVLARLVEERTREIQFKTEEIAAQNEELSTQSEILFFQNEQLEGAKAGLEEKIQERTLSLKQLNNELANRNMQLEQFAFITAHNIRGPVARIKGLIHLLPNKGNADELIHLENSIDHLDEVIRDLNLVLNIRHRGKSTCRSYHIRRSFDSQL